MKSRIIVVGLVTAGIVAGCAVMSTDPVTRRAVTVMKTSFKEKGQAKLDRLDQDDMQRLCSRTDADGPAPSEVAETITKRQLAAVRYPADGKLMGDWKEGEKIAQSGVGKQYSDDPGRPAGGNCYACHQLSKKELAYGTIGPSLYQFGKMRGTSVEIQRYTYGKVYNPNAYVACSSMPRFGHNGILTEKQIKDVVALLLDPQSPVNQ